MGKGWALSLRYYDDDIGAVVPMYFHDPLSFMRLLWEAQSELERKRRDLTEIVINAEVNYSRGHEGEEYVKKYSRKLEQVCDAMLHNVGQVDKIIAEVEGLKMHS